MTGRSNLYLEVDYLEQMLKREEERTEATRKALLDAQEEIERLRDKCDKQATVLKAAFPEQSGGFFICGESGEKDRNGMPNKLLVCPAYGLDWFVVYKKQPSDDVNQK